MNSVNFRTTTSTHHVFVEQTWSVTTSLLADSKKDDEDSPFSWMRPNEIFLTGTTPASFAFREAALSSGSWFLPEDLTANARVVVLSEGLARNLYGDEDPLGQLLPVEPYGDDEPVFYTVIGVLAPAEAADESYLTFQENRTAYTPVTASPYFRWEEDRENRFRQISIGIDKGVDLDQALEVAQSEVKLIWGDRAKVRSPLADLKEAQRQLKNYAFLIGIFASIGLVIAVINILNLMLARVLKRTKGIGISMALGSSRQLVFRQFVLEAFSLGLIGSLLGILLSFGLVFLLERALGAVIFESVHGVRIFLGITIGIVVSILFGSYPAYLASKTNPVDALRTD